MCIDENRSLFPQDIQGVKLLHVPPQNSALNINDTCVYICSPFLKRGLYRVYNIKYMQNRKQILKFKCHMVKRGTKEMVPAMGPKFSVNNMIYAS